MKTPKEFNDLPDLRDFPIGERVGYLKLNYGSRESQIPIFIVAEAFMTGDGWLPGIGFDYSALEKAIKGFEPAATVAQAEEATRWMNEFIFYHIHEGGSTSGEDDEVATGDFDWPHPMKWRLLFYDWFVARGEGDSGKDWSP